MEKKIKHLMEAYGQFLSYVQLIKTNGSLSSMPSNEMEGHIIQLNLQVNEANIIIILRNGKINSLETSLKDEYV